MLSLRYHRQYLWIFFILFFLLMCGALWMDCYFVLNGSSSGSSSSKFELKTPRFINVACVFIFALLSAVFQNYLSRAIFKTDLLAADRRNWMAKKIFLKRKRKLRKCVKRRNRLFLTLGFLAIHIFNYIPLIILWSLLVANVSGVSDACKFNNFTQRSTLCPEFFVPALMIRYVSWYFTTLLSKFSAFKHMPRRRLMVVEPISI